MKIEPIYQLKIHGDSWIDQAKHSYEYNVKHGPAVVRAVYTEAQLRQLGEACAVAAWNTGMDLHMKQHDSREVGSAGAAAIRELIKELLP